MSPLKFTGFRIDDEDMRRLRDIATETGIPVAEQVRRAIREWLDSKGVQPRTPEPTSNRRRPAGKS